MRQLYPRDGRLRAIINQLYQKQRGFQVYIDIFYLKGVTAASYIGRYLGHPPLAMSRLTHYIGQRVCFWYKETATSLRHEVLLSALDFISLMVKHIPPKGMQLMRHAGLYARSTKCSLAGKEAGVESCLLESDPEAHLPLAIFRGGAIGVIHTIAPDGNGKGYHISEGRNLSSVGYSKSKENWWMPVR